MKLFRDHDHSCKTLWQTKSIATNNSLPESPERVSIVWDDIKNSLAVHESEYNLHSLGILGYS